MKWMLRERPGLQEELFLRDTLLSASWDAGGETRGSRSFPDPPVGLQGIHVAAGSIS